MPEAVVTDGWRRARPNEDSAIIDRCLALNREDPGPDPVTRGQVQHTLATLRREPLRGTAVVLHMDDDTDGKVDGEADGGVGGSVGGYALLVSFWSNELGGEVCVVDELYVDPDHRGSGYATALFGDLDRLWARPRVADALETTPGNTRARAFYERLGFHGANLALNRPVTPPPPQAE